MPGYFRAVSLRSLNSSDRKTCSSVDCWSALLCSLHTQRRATLSHKDMRHYHQLPGYFGAVSLRSVNSSLIGKRAVVWTVGLHHSAVFRHRGMRHYHTKTCDIITQRHATLSQVVLRLKFGMTRCEPVTVRFDIVMSLVKT